MRQSDKDRLLNMVSSATDKFEHAAIYDAIALAERDEKDAAAAKLLHDAALELMKGNVDKTLARLNAIIVEH
jgi:hypothetical protein